MRYSIQKNMISNLLKTSGEHISTDNIHKKLLIKYPGISLMTVYRNLKKMVKDGEIIEFHVNHKAHYCGNMKKHQHLHCVNCGNIYDIVLTERELTRTYDFVKKNSFTPIANFLIIKGICNNCNNN